MKKNHTYLIFSLIILIILFVSRPICAHAANIGLSIYPPLVRVVIKPGKSITQAFSITNLSKEDTTLIARLVPFTSSDSLGNPNIDPRSTAPWLDYFSLANSYIKLGEPFEIKAEKSEQIILALSIPPTAPLKDLYATLLVTTYTNALPNQSLQGSSLSASIGSNLLVTINTQSSPATILKIVDLEPEKNKYIKLGNYYLLDNITPIYFTAKAENDGEYTAETKGVFKIQQGETPPIDQQSVLPQYILAKSQRLLSNLEDTKFHFSPSFNQIGKYTVGVDVRSENANASTKIEVIFIPGKILLGIFLALLFLNITLKISTAGKNDTTAY